MNVPPPMKTSRVREALASLAGHVVNARDIAAAVQPISLVRPNIEPVVVIPVPRIESVKVSGKTCEVKGKHLTKVVNFMLVPVGSPNNILVGSIKNARDSSIDADLLSDPVEGAYFAFVIDKQGRADVFSLEIKAPTVPGSIPVGNVSCAIAAVVPNAAVVICEEGVPKPDKVFVEVICGGDRFPDDVTFLAPPGSGLTCEMAIMTGDPKVRVIPIHITSAPAMDRHQVVAIDVKPTSTAKSEATFDFNLLLRHHLAQPSGD